MTALALICLIIAIGARSLGELQQHGKLKWQKNTIPFDGFWGLESWRRKYKLDDRGHPIANINQGWYAKTFKIGFIERWPTSATFTVLATDGFHMCQALYNLMLSLSAILFMELPFGWIWLAVYAGVVGSHALFYRIFQR